MKKWAAALHKLAFVRNFLKNGGKSLDSCFKASWLNA